MVVGPNEAALTWNSLAANRHKETLGEWPIVVRKRAAWGRPFRKTL